MATLISNASGNLTGAATFAAVEVGALALNLIRFSNTQSAAAGTVTSVTFTVTTGKVIDAILLWLSRDATTLPTGTFKADLQKGGVSQASVTVNKVDLPGFAGGGLVCPTLLKLTSTATGDGGSNWTIVLTTTGTGQVSYGYAASGQTTNFTRALRTTTAATPAAADDLYITGELTGAGTHNSITVTMDSTATTAYGNGALNSTSVAGGGIYISCYGTLSYGTGASTAYVLRVNGDVIVYQFGTLNVGSVTIVSATTWDTATATAVTLSGNNLVATNTGTISSNQGARVSSLAALSSGKYYFEIAFTNIAATAGSINTAIGVAQTSASYSSIGDFQNGCCTLAEWGNIANMGSSTGFFFPQLSSGNNIGIALDLDNRKIWFKVLPSSNWNNNGTANPVTNVNGASIPTGALTPVCVFGGSSNVSGNVITANFGTTAFAGAVPSGFNSGWPTITGGEIPRTSTAVLEFQQLSADGDFGLRCLDNAVVNIAGLSRTSGKAVVKCKLTADVASASMNMGSWNNTSSAGAGVASLEASGNSLTAINFLDNASNTTHYLYWQASAAVTNITLTASVWLARGSGTNNRYVRVYVSGSTVSASNSFFSEIDLQVGTVGTVTALGSATAINVSITPCGRGYVVRVTGKVSSGAITPSIWLLTCSAPGTTSYAGNSTECFICDHVALVQTASISDTTFNVDTDTGWLAGDAVCVASTTRTATDCEIYPLNANAGASSFISPLYPFGSNPGGFANFSTHHGTAPVQAEIGLLTRNVKIRSTSTTLMSYVYCTALSTVTVSWAEFYYLGASGAGKRGIEIDTANSGTANLKSFTYCSLHDFDNNGLYCTNAGAQSLNVIFSNNIGWLTYSNAFVTIVGSIANTDWTFDSNLFMRIANIGFNLSDVGGIWTNNTVVGNAGSNGFVIGEAAPLGTFSGNTVHSGASGGLNVASSGIAGTISNFTAWRNNGAGVLLTASSYSDLSFSNLTLFGNATASQGNFSAGTGDAITINGGLIAGDTTFASLYGIVASSTTLTKFNLSSVDMSGSGGIYAPHATNDFNINIGAIGAPFGQCINCKFGATNVLSAKTNWVKGAYLGFEKYNQTAGDHRTEMTYGQLRTDATVYNTAAPSMKMTPNSASNKLESAPLGRGMLVPVASGSSTTVSVWVRKDASYNGNQPRLIARANPAVGINADTVLATYSVGTGSWNILSGTTIAATDDGAMEFIVDCDGSAGYINIDDWAAT